MKNVGVPETPLRSALSTSSATRPAPTCVAQVVGEAVDVEPELLGVARSGRRPQRVLVVEQQVVHLPERALRGRGLGGLGRELGVRVDVGQRQVAPDVADVAEVASSSRTTGSAWPQYGHSKSPYSTTVTGASSGPRMWSRSGSTVDREVDERLGGAEQGPDRARCVAAAPSPGTAAR